MEVIGTPHDIRSQAGAGHVGDKDPGKYRPEVTQPEIAAGQEDHEVALRSYPDSHQDGGNNIQGQVLPVDQQPDTEQYREKDADRHHGRKQFIDDITNENTRDGHADTHGGDDQGSRGHVNAPVGQQGGQLAEDAVQRKGDAGNDDDHEPEHTGPERLA